MGEQDGKHELAGLKPTALESYQRKNRSPLTSIALVTLVLLMVAMGVVTLSLADGQVIRIFSAEWVRTHSARWLYERHIFVLYACIFSAWWVVYFVSRKPAPGVHDPAYKQVRSLRRLLGECSEQWSDLDARRSQSSTGFSDKAQSSMTTITILIAVAALELQEVSKLLAPLLESGFALTWPVVVLGLSLSLVMVSFIGYIVSADALDVIFNNFVDDDSRHRIRRYYYQGTINPRYAALISLIASFILLVAYYSPLAGSAAIGLFFVIGYAHWFPSFDEAPVSWMRCIAMLLVKAMLVLAPFLPLLLGWRS
jgi:hypothetical protein